MRALAVASVVVGAALGARDAAAQTPVRVRVDYSAAAGCPSASSFAAELSSRSRSTRVVDESATPERTVTVTVHIEARGARYAGSATFSEKGKPDTERRIEGDSCEEVVHAIAFVSAVAIDGEESKAPETKEREPERPTTAEPEKRATERPVPRAERPPRAERAEPFVYSLSAGANGQAVSGPMPNVLFAVPLFVDVARAAGGFGQSARIRFERVSGSTQQASAGADFTWTVVSLDACPFGAFSGALRADGCLRAVAGALDASGAGVLPPRSASRPWVSLGAAARGRWEFASPFFLEAEAALDFPMVRDRFFVEPNTTVFRPAVAGWGVAAGLGMTLF